MIISEFIKKLEAIKAKEGDIPVVDYNFEDNVIFYISKDEDGYYGTMLVIE